jgi:hypothetical protein
MAAKLSWRFWPTLQFSLRTLLLLFALLGALLAYVGSYVTRSAHGRYEPMVIGLVGVKWYDWAPHGFVTDFQWDKDQIRFYYPLWRLDRRFWHPPHHASDRARYPINEPSDIGQVYRAWQQQADETGAK